MGYEHEFDVNTHVCVSCDMTRKTWKDIQLAAAYGGSKTETAWLNKFKDEGYIVLDGDPVICPLSCPQCYYASGQPKNEPLPHAKAINFGQMEKKVVSLEMKSKCNLSGCNKDHEKKKNLDAWKEMYGNSALPPKKKSVSKYLTVEEGFDICECSICGGPEFEEHFKGGDLDYEQLFNDLPWNE